MSLVRVKLEDGSEVSVGEQYATDLGLNVLDGEPAADARGGALAAKSLTTVDEAAAKKPTAKRAAKKSTAARKGTQAPPADGPSGDSSNTGGTE